MSRPRSGFSSRKLNYLRRHGCRFRDGALLDNGFRALFRRGHDHGAAIRARIYNRGFWLRNDAESMTALQSGPPDSFPISAQTGTRPIEQFMLGDLTVHMPASLLQRLDRCVDGALARGAGPVPVPPFRRLGADHPEAILKLRRGVGKYVLRQRSTMASECAGRASRASRCRSPTGSPAASTISPRYLALVRRGRWSWIRGAGASVRRARRGAADHGRMLYAIAMFSCWWIDQRQIAAGERSVPIASWAM